MNLRSSSFRKRDTLPPKTSPNDGTGICKLPIEILLTIVEHLIQPEILSLLQTCRRMRDCLEPCLYRNITLGWKNKDAIDQLIRTLKSRPNLGYHCTSFGAFLCRLVPLPKTQPIVGSWATWTKIPVPWKQKPELALSTFFKTLPNLRSVWFHPYHVNTAWPVPDGLLQMSFVPNVSLTTFEVGSTIGSTWSHLRYEKAFHESIRHVLDHQPLIEKLTLPFLLVPILSSELASTSLRKLETLTCMADEARLLVPGRPVTDLKLHNTPVYAIEETWKAISLSTGPITRMGITLAPQSLDKLELAIVLAQIGTVKHLELFRVFESAFLTVSFISEVQFAALYHVKTAKQTAINSSH